MLGVYFHWPYCLSKCIYCDFGSSVKNQNSLTDEEYIYGCKKQIDYFASHIKKQPITSIYFGGGTPSLLEPTTIEVLIEYLHKHFEFAERCEITLEANPTSCEMQKFLDLHKAGINRLSIGVQSLDDNELKFLGRQHSVAEALKTLEEANRVFDNWTFDLIYGLPNQTLDGWLTQLNQAVQLGSKHISLYTLIVDEFTKLGAMVRAGEVVPKTEDELSLFYDETNQFLKTTSFKQYEVSNYAKQGFQSVHNIGYWKNEDYICLGPGAHGRLFYNDSKRYELLSEPNQTLWLKSFENTNNHNSTNKTPNGLKIERQMTNKEIAYESVLMGLRTIYGVNLNDFQNRFGVDLIEFIDKQKLKTFCEENKMIFENNTINLTYSGLKVLDWILGEVVI